MGVPTFRRVLLVRHNRGIVGPDIIRCEFHLWIILITAHNPVICIFKQGAPRTDNPGFPWFNIKVYILLLVGIDLVRRLWHYTEIVLVFVQGLQIRILWVQLLNVSIDEVSIQYIPLLNTSTCLTIIFILQHTIPRLIGICNLQLRVTPGALSNHGHDPLVHFLVRILVLQYLLNLLPLQTIVQLTLAAPLSSRPSFFWSCSLATLGSSCGLSTSCFGRSALLRYGALDILYLLQQELILWLNSVGLFDENWKNQALLQVGCTRLRNTLRRNNNVLFRNIMTRSSMILVVGIIINTGLARSTLIILHIAAFAGNPARRLNLQLRLREVILPGSLSYNFRPLLPQILLDLEIRF